MKIPEHIYKPLPPFLTIAPSKIHGIGLHSKGHIAEGTLLGVSHIHSSLIVPNVIDITSCAHERGLAYYVEGNHEHLKGITMGTNVYLNKDTVFPNSLVRTPLGGFINHCDDNNCSLVYLNEGLWGIITLVDIEPEDELTLNYQFTPCGVIKEKS